MRQPEKKRRTVGIRGQLMWFLCFICLLLLVLFWFLCTQLLEPLYTTHIQKQLTEQADAIVQKLDDAIADGQTLSYWGFGSQDVYKRQRWTSSPPRTRRLFSALPVPAALPLPAGLPPGSAV